MRRPSRLPSALLALVAASCAAPRKPAPAPLPPAAPPVSRPSVAADWRDLPVTKGAWRYVRDADGGVARFEAGGAALFVIRCDRTTRRISLARTDAPRETLKITTSYGVRTLAAPGLPAGDALLDQIAFSRGRFTVEAAGRPELVLPAWAEPARVIEDCRG